MFAENFLVVGSLTAAASLVAFALKKGQMKDALEIFSAFAAFALFYPFAILMSPLYIVIYYIGVTRRSGVSGTKREVAAWFSSYKTPNSKKSRANSHSFSPLPEVAEEVSS
jgi:hypothetical protein